ncbi:interleukin enhancer-binding factor 2-like [Brachionus plicatilis]|uniref:Interleukin enhancer-binding factor 2-like n=1 Tax=Brachionus plicatilis TaxID=10195 RepID=A0A3M7SWP3_BRAPC|nr:interleukin enhancer-binding factor 2-like [Brachionus plicatilis]
MRGNYQGQRNIRGRSFATNQRNFGRGGTMQNRPFQQRHQPKPFIPHVCFDLIQAESSFQRVKPVNQTEEKALNDVLLKRNQDLTPTPNEQTHLLNLISKIQIILDNLILSPADFDACTMDEIRQVGSFKKGTMLMSNKLVADLCVVLKTLPTREAVSRLAAKVFEEVRKTISNPLELSNLQLSLNESGFEILSPALIAVSAVDVAVQVLVTTQQQNIRKLEPDLHLDSRICQLSLNSVKHARWFEENASHSTIKVLIRVLKDIRHRFDGLSPMNPWIIDLLAHHAVLNNPKREPLNLVVAFKRVFQLISAGFFLPGSAGIIDPCEGALVRVHTNMNLEQQDMVCYTSQTLFRVLAHGGYKQILGFEGYSSITTSPSVWSGVVVIPSSKAFEPAKEETSSSANADDQDISDLTEENQLKGENMPQIELTAGETTNLMV